MIVAFACDHAGFPLRNEILNYLKDLGHTVRDWGPQNIEPLDDFPDYAGSVCRDVLSWDSERGILVCGTGIGMSIAANRFRNIRAVLAYSWEIAHTSRSHNDANVICFWARTMSAESVLASLDMFLSTPFLGDKYQRRNDKIEGLC